MKTLHIITALNVGGAETALYNILHGGLSKKFDTCVVSLCDIGVIGLKIRSLGVPDITLNMNSGMFSIFNLTRLIKIVRVFQPDIVQGWMYHGNFAAIFSSVLASKKTKLVWNIRHSLSDIAYEKRMTRIMIKLNQVLSFRVDKILYNSFASKAQHENFGFFSKKGTVIPNGINLDKFYFSNDICKRVRSDLVIPNDAKVIGHVARLHPMKDHQLFFSVAIKLALKHPKIHFIVCGRGVPSSSLVKTIPDEVSNRFHILDESDEIHSLMNAMNIFCLSSAWGEGFPNVLGEAMSVGIPCVSTNVGDSKLVIGDTGKIVKPCDEDAFFASIETLLENSLKDFYNLGVNARKRIEDNYSLNKIVQLYAKLYNEIAKESRIKKV